MTDIDLVAGGETGRRPTVAELFAGVGGFHLALDRAGFDVVWSNQWEPATRAQHAFDCYVRHVRNSGLLKINDSHIGFVSYLSTHGGTGKTGGPSGELNYVGLRTTHLQGVCWGDGDPRPLDPRVASTATGRS